MFKHIQFITITCKQKDKRVEPHVLKVIYGSSIILQFKGIGLALGRKVKQ